MLTLFTLRSFILLALYSSLFTNAVLSQQDSKFSNTLESEESSLIADRFAEKEPAVEFDPLIDANRSADSCAPIMPYFYNHAMPFCPIDDLVGECFLMGPPFPPAFSIWPGCNPPNDVAFDNPQWVTFVAGDTSFSIDVEISDCIGTGVQIALYELGFDYVPDPSGIRPGIQPTADMLVSDCDLTTSAQIGVLNFEVNDIEPGTIYGLVFDGWANAVCKVEILEVLAGGGPPDTIDQDFVGFPTFELGGYSVGSGDTICLGAMNVPFFIEDGREGQFIYEWFINGELVDNRHRAHDSASFNFPDTGAFEICIRATNFCSYSDPHCVQFYVAPADTLIQHDTIGTGEAYRWLGPYEPVENGFIDPIGTSGSYVFYGRTRDSIGCILVVELHLEVVRQKITCSGRATEVVEITNPVTDRVWMDRNLGAERPAYILRDSRAFGDLYQWGRFGDGHQCRNSPLTDMLAETGEPGHDSFIVVTTPPRDWLMRPEDGLWRGGGAINNPCPDGFRLPTVEEWNEEIRSWIPGLTSNSFSSYLRMPLSGMRRTNGDIAMERQIGYYWTSSVAGDQALVVVMTPNFVFARPADRATGYSVRCILDNVPGTGSLVGDPSEIFYDLEDAYGIDPIEDTGLQLYPNPSRGRILLEITELQVSSYHIHIFDLKGRMVRTNTVDQPIFEMDLSDLSPGLYLIRALDTFGNLIGDEKLVLE